MEVDIQDFTSLIEVLCALNVTFYVWDGLAQRIINDKRKRAKAKEVAYRNARRDMLLEHEEQNGRVIAHAERVMMQLDEPNSRLREDIGETISSGQGYCLAAALLLIVILVVTGLWPSWPSYELPVLWLCAGIAAFILVAAAPIWGTVNGIEHHWLKWTKQYEAMKRSTDRLQSPESGQGLGKAQTSSAAPG